MKKIILSLILTFTLLILSNVESKGQCETGYTSKTLTIQVGNCDYGVEVCYKCELHHPGTIRMKKFWLIDSNCVNSLDIDIVVNSLYLEISDGSFILTNFCPDGLYNTPPCNEQGTSYNEFTFYYAYCWQQWYRSNGVAFVREYWPCEENAGCEERIKVCWDEDEEEFVTDREVISPPQDPPCELQWFEVTWPTTLGKSQCFILNTIPCGIE
jgi:hypothetical protein